MAFKFRFPALAIPFTRTRPLSEWAFFGTLFYFALLCIWIYLQYVQPWISGQILTRIGADSDRYWEAAELARTSQTFALLTLAGNYLGPVAIANTLGNGFYVLCFNLCLFLLAIKIAWSISAIHKALVGFLFLANAELIPAITTLNKEIIALLAAVLTVKYIHSEKKAWIYLCLALAVSIFARWEQAALLLLYLILNRLGIRKSHPWLAIALIVAIITICYPFTYQYLGSLDWLLDGATTLVAIDTIQKRFGFPLTVGPKVFMTVTGNLHSLSFYNPQDWLTNLSLDAQNTLFLPLSCLSLTIVLTYAFRTGRLAIGRPVAFLAALTLIVSAVPVFIQPRYLYGVYAMLCIEVARPREVGVSISPGNL